MEHFLLQALTIFAILHNSAAGKCSEGWTAYKDELCILASTDVFSYDEAKQFCNSKSHDGATVSLVMVKESSMQEFLSEFTKDFHDNLWLGARYENASNEFKWDDGDPVEFTNWAEGYPKQTTNSEMCIQLRPINAKSGKIDKTKWEVSSCQKRNLALCQQILVWNLEDATREILVLRRDLKDTKQDLTTKLEAQGAQIFPVGSVYVQYHNQLSPDTLWPTMKWNDITVSYAGLFFRAYGTQHGSEDWGVTQDECSPKILAAQYTKDHGDRGDQYTHFENGWSPVLQAGEVYERGSRYFQRLQFYTYVCEVRPRNQAIRIWKRLD